MREIVHIQAGQCGNQIGAKVWFLYFVTLGYNWALYMYMSRDMTKLQVWSVFAVRSVGSWGPKVSSCGQRRLWSDWTDANADLSLRCAHTHFVDFVMAHI